MNVTINTDASFNHHHKVGGYAFWITSELGRIRQSGTLKETSDAQDAELKALANAVYALLNSEFNNGSIEHIYVNSDCKMMFPKISIKSTSVPGKYIAETLNDILRQNTDGCIYGRISFRHVKAHTNNLTKSRSWVNDWCDNEAKKAMRSAVEILKQEMSWKSSPN